MSGSLSRRRPGPPRVVVVGGGFAGFYALRHLQRHLPPGGAELVLVNPNDYLLYSPLLPEVATGVVEARHIAVSLRRTLRRGRLGLGRGEGGGPAGRPDHARRGGSGAGGGSGPTFSPTGAGLPPVPDP